MKRPEASYIDNSFHGYIHPYTRQTYTSNILHQLTGTCSEVVAQLWAWDLAVDWNGSIEDEMSASCCCIVCRTPIAVKGRKGGVALKEEQEMDQKFLVCKTK